MCAIIYLFICAAVLILSTKMTMKNIRQQTFFCD